LSDTQWMQAALPLKHGGLGLRRVSTLAVPTFLASVSSTPALQSAIFPSEILFSDSFSAEARDSWSAQFGSPPVGQLAFKQSSWDSPGVVQVRESVSTNLRSLREKACFLAACAPHSGAWLSALPLSSCGLCLDDESVRIGVALRLGLPLCSPHDCRCGAPVDSWGSHAMV